MNEGGWGAASMGVLVLAVGGAALLIKSPSHAAPWSAPVSQIGGRAYAREVVELHFRSPDGPVVGHAYVGARVDVKPVNERTVQVGLPPERQGDAEKKEWLWLYAAKSGFTTSFVKLVPPNPYPKSHVVPAAFGNDLWLTEDGWNPFASTVCGQVRVLGASRQGGSHVSQIVDNVELEGWTNYPPLSQARGCEARHIERENGKLVLRGGTTSADREEVSAIPRDFVTFDSDGDGGADALQKKLEAGATFHVLSPKPVIGGGRCYVWKSVGKGDAARLVRDRRLVDDEGKREYVSYDWAYRARERELVLFGPHYHPDRRPLADPTGGYRCARSRHFAGLADGAVRLSYFGPNGSALAWHPNDEERWYETAELCEAARVKFDEGRSRGELLPAGNPYYDDCFGAFGEKDEE